MSSIQKDSKIIVVGAGVFGLSNALYLADNGYTNVTVFDRLDFDSNSYTFLKGADTASADLNKIFRAQYAEKKYYQDLAFKAFDIWQQWNQDIQLLPADEAIKYSSLELLNMCGLLKLDDRLSAEEKASRENFEKDGLSPLRYDIQNEADIKRARAAGLSSKIKPALDLKQEIPTLQGSLDTSSGILYASRACMYAQYLCRKKGVKFILGGDKGKFVEFKYNDPQETQVGGIVTKDGAIHHADLTVISCGPWSTRLVPELDGMLEGSSGNVVFFKIPDERRDLKVKYSIKNFPIMGWKNGYSRETDYMAGFFLFPICEPEGYMKVIVRQTKYINPVRLDNDRVVSIPTTSTDNPPSTHLTKHIVSQITEWLRTFFPDIYEAKLHYESRLLWYTDTVDNNYVYDFVPNKTGLFVASGGSGHAFKMLPVLGQFLVDKIEGRENFYTRLFKWRDLKAGTKAANKLGEGFESLRNYQKQDLASDEDLQFGCDRLSSGVREMTISDSKL